MSLLVRSDQASSGSFCNAFSLDRSDLACKITTHTKSEVASVEGMEGASLRERSKARRRTNIQFTAMRLFAEQGYDATTIVGIAEAAEVAPRTVTLYFSTKLDIALASASAAVARLTEQLHQQSAGTSVIDTLLRWVDGESLTTLPEERQLRRRMYLKNPALRALSTVQSEDALRVALELLAAELQTKADDIAVRIAIAGIVGAVQEYEFGAAGEDDEPAARHALAAFLLGGVSALKPL